MTAFKRMVPVLFLAMTLGACDTDRILNVLPVDAISNEIAIIDGPSAQAALYGAYSALQSGGYYGDSYTLWSELMTESVKHTGTFGTWGDADLLQVLPSNGTLDGMWRIMYDGINRVNNLIQKVPEIDAADISAIQANEILGQAYGLRALGYFSLVRAWGDVPLVLIPPVDLEVASQVTRAPVGDVWAQIESDLSQALTHLGGMSNDDRIFITPGFIYALQARAALYQEDWAGAVSAARQLVATGDYALADDFGDLFTAEGTPTSEDIFRVLFTEVDANSMGFYYQLTGRFEIGATYEIYNAYPAGDLRHDVTFGSTEADGIEVTKWPTAKGTEDFLVVRYAGILLLMAEALAEQGSAANLEEAVGYVNDVRTRAGVTPYTYGVDLTTKQEVLDAVFLERRLELAFEGEYWFDLVRTGRAAAALGPDFDSHEGLWPLPVAELDVAPNLVQNPGY